MSGRKSNNFFATWSSGLCNFTNFDLLPSIKLIIRLCLKEHMK
jgi:hypothetical protein